MKFIKKDLTGQKIGKLLILDSFLVYEGSQNRRYHTCICDCGNIKKIRRETLLLGEAVSCGCYNVERIKERFRLGGEGRFWNQRFYFYRYAAKNRNLDFALSLEEFKIISQKNCFYCGKAPEKNFALYDKRKAQAIKDNTNIDEDYFKTYIVEVNGIDRINNIEGYTLKNCVPCCEHHNTMKMDSSYEDFLKDIKHMYEYLNLGDK